MCKRHKYHIRESKKVSLQRTNRLKKELVELLQTETGIQSEETLGFFLQDILRKNANEELFVPTYVVDWLIMVAYMTEPDEHILMILIDVLQSPHDFTKPMTD